MAPPLPGDKSGGFTGLVVAAILLAIILYGIVRLTNRHYDKLEAAKPAATATQ